MRERSTPLPGDGVAQAVYAVTERVQQRLMAHFRGTNLHWGLRRILQQLWIEDGRSQVELARATQASEASISNLLKHLVSGGWVERRPDPFDYRVSRIFLTQKGTALRDAIERECRDIDRQLRQCLGDAEASQLTAALYRAHDVLASTLLPQQADKGIGIYDQPSPPGEL